MSVPKFFGGGREDSRRQPAGNQLSFQLNDVSGLTSEFSNMNARPQAGQANLRYKADNPEEVDGPPLSINLDTQPQGAQAGTHNPSSFAARDSRRYPAQGSNNNAIVSFSKYPLPNTGKASGISGRQGSTHRTSQNRVQSQGQGQGKGQGRPDGPPQAPAKPYHIGRFTTDFKSGVAEMKQAMAQAPMSAPHKEYVQTNIRKLDLVFDCAQQELQHEWNVRATEYNQVCKELENARQANVKLVTERKQVTRERNDLELKLAQLRLRHKSSSDKLTELDQEWKTKNNILKEQLRIQEEQLSGKRALWMASNPGSSARRSAMTALRDPFQSPTLIGQDHDDNVIGCGQDESYSLPPALHSLSANSISASFDQAVGMNMMNMSMGAPPRGSKGRGLLPTGKAKTAPVQPYPNHFGSLPFPTHITTEPGDTTLNSMYGPPTTSMTVDPSFSSALVLHGDYIDPSPPYQFSLEELFDGCENWAKRFACTPNPEGDRVIAQSNQELWQYMTHCTYPEERQNAYTHTKTLMQDPTTKSWFVMRMMVQFFVDQVMNITTFRKFSSHHDQILDEVKLAMKERGMDWPDYDSPDHQVLTLGEGLANEARQVQINKQARAVQSIIESPEFKDFRRSRLSTYSRTLRDMLGPVLDVATERVSAGQELGKLTIKAFDLSMMMFSSFVTFQIFFPETCTKYTGAIMASRDHPNENPNVLQTKQIRVKLVITPVITLRDDRTTTIRVKNLLHANVLLMG
ncbi:hypothetical protein BJ878DRAFT_479007 [Calycina marina]|uniref:Uncharacterized protein n=1 Tax=Calycina marina TaxID=1763456 RepID=A0A9P8CFZ4_9HELO|nr:hypothetical protein BJ878DRAFT_479007 [Calycina marina]